MGHQGSEDKKVSNLLQKGDDNDEDKGGSGLSDILGAAKSGLKEAGAAIMKKGEAAIKEKIEEVKKEGLKKAEAAIKSKVDEKLLQKHQGSEAKRSATCSKRVMTMMRTKVEAGSAIYWEQQKAGSRGRKQ